MCSKETQKVTTELMATHDIDNETMTNTNNKHTRINEDEPPINEDQTQIEEKKMRGEMQWAWMTDADRWNPNLDFTF